MAATLGFSFGGFILCNEMAAYHASPRSFGHLGLSGTIAFGDREAKLGFSFGLNRIAGMATYFEPYAGPLMKAVEQRFYQ